MVLECSVNVSFIHFLQNGIYFIVDEVQTGGGATGLWWYSNSWNLPSPPDALVFSKKTLTGGFYCTDELLQQEVSKILQSLFQLYFGSMGMAHTGAVSLIWKHIFKKTLHTY